MHMVDTSVWVWAQRVPDLREDLVDHATADAIVLCHPVLFELLYSARNAIEFGAIRDEFEAYPFVQVGDAVWQRALDVNHEMAQQGGTHHRQVRHADLLIAAAAEAAGLPVLHYDEDYDRIAAVTGQATHWVRPRGSL
jgi:predicted nucleic acid-binding protein